MSYFEFKHFGPEEDEADQWLADHADDIPEVVGSIFDDPDVVSTDEIIDTDDEPTYTIDDSDDE